MIRVKTKRRSIAGLSGSKRSPTKGGRSPFKRKTSANLGHDILGDSEAANGGQNAPANIRVAVRVRPENEREMTMNCR